MSAQEEYFFKGQKKHMLVKPGGTGPLKEGTTRMIRLGLKMSLDDGKLVGMPSYIAEGYNVLAKENSLIPSAPIDVELAGMEAHFYATNATKDASLKVEGCTFSKFSVVRSAPSRDGEAPAIHLHFSLRTNGWVPALWSWLGDNFGSEFWMGFNSSQMSLVFVGQPEEEEEPAEDLAQTPERKAATAPEMDTVFGKPVTATEKPKSPARKKAEDALSGKGPTLIH